jgi:ABC-type transport system substrate-binding protein
VVLRPASPRLADIRVRAAVQAAIDRESLIATGTGNGPSAQLKAGSLVVPPTAPGYAASLPTGAPPAVVDLATTERLLTQAGYVKQDNQWVKDGHPLSLVVAAPADREPYPTLATQVQHMLAAAGIGAKVKLVAADELFGQTLAQPVNDKGVEGDDAVDVVLAPQVDTGDPATVLASTFGCRTALPDGGPQPPANLSGYCDPTLQPTIDAALSGDVLLSDALARVEPVLWQEAVSIPLFQTADVLSSRPEVSGVDSGAPFAGPFSGAPNWRRPNR